ncbi:MAG: hypothetical protein L0L09_13505 [Staphylococcus equorum]|nr:hypothetical protein [Staphylococcus equorum]
MEQVSPEVKEAYLNNLTYTTINKKDWEALNGKYNVDNAVDKQTIFANCLIVLAGVIIIASIVTSFILYNPFIMLFILSAIIPVIALGIEIRFDIFYNMIKKKDRFLYNYRKANDTFSVLIKGNDKYRYYSRWYLELINPKVEAQSISRTRPEDETRYINFNDNGCIVTYDHPMKGSQPTRYELHPVTRHHDRFNWRNTLSTNRVLSIKEYKNLIKSEEELKKLMEMDEDIREF